MPGRNAAIRIARGRYFALLDADDEWLPHHLVESVAALERHPQAGFVHANIERIDARGNTLHVPPRYWRDDDYALVGSGAFELRAVPGDDIVAGAAERGRGEVVSIVQRRPNALVLWQ